MKTNPSESQGRCKGREVQGDLALSILVSRSLLML